MVKRRYAALTASVAVIAMAGCGTENGTLAEDPAPTQTSPTAQPTVGTYPAFGPEDYTFHLAMSCFCLGAGVPIEVTVKDAAVVHAVYLADDTGRGGTKKGDTADKLFWLTINDIIEAANNTAAARVEVVWPAGQDYPTSVYVDENENTIDEEIGYAVSEVRVG